MMKTEKIVFQGSHVGKFSRDCRVFYVYSFEWKSYSGLFSELDTFSTGSKLLTENIFF